MYNSYSLSLSLSLSHTHTHTLPLSQNTGIVTVPYDLKDTHALSKNTPVKACNTNIGRERYQSSERQAYTTTKVNHNVTVGSVTSTEMCTLH